jgi:hypothetical protein
VHVPRFEYYYITLYSAKLTAHSDSFSTDELKQVANGSSLVAYQLSNFTNTETQDVHGHPQRRLQQLEVWNNCWSGQETVSKSMIVGVAVDYGYWEAIGSSQAKLDAGLQQLFADANQVYVFIFSIVLCIWISTTQTTSQYKTNE